MEYDQPPINTSQMNILIVIESDCGGSGTGVVFHILNWMAIGQSQPPFMKPKISGRSIHKRRP